MNFTTFSVANTNIFPHANSKYGGQLMSEFNVRSREMVSVNPSIKFECGPSFVHCVEDFQVSASGSKVIVAPGRGVINGHFIETLTPMEIDLLEANIIAKQRGMEALKGTLDIGIRIFYSTEPTMAGTMLVTRSTGSNTEDSTDDIVEEVYVGVQLVILPKDKLITPSESPSDLSKVTAHLRIGRVTYYNGVVEVVANSASDGSDVPIDIAKLRYIPAERIMNLNQILTDGFITSTGLDNKLYVFSGKSNNWCDASHSLIMWENSETKVIRNGVNVSPKIGQTADNRLALQLYRMPLDGDSEAEAIQILFPSANYGAGTSGVVDSAYTNSIKEIESRFSEIYQTKAGKQVGFIDVKDGDTVMPPINKEQWAVGDYILVNQDYTIDEVSDGVKAPASMYIVVPGQVMNLDFGNVKTATVEYTIDTTGKLISGSQEEEVPKGLKGTQLRFVERQAASRQDDPSGMTAEEKLYMFNVPDDIYLRGTVGEDYVVCKYVYEPVDNVDEDTGKLISTTYKYVKYYYIVSESKPLQYSPAVMLTGQIPLAQEQVIGGFYNVPSDAIDGGYVYRDDNGHLRLLDYALLRTGVLAYQLGEDWSTTVGATSDVIQDELDEYVNQRVAFPNANASGSNMIHITLNLSKETEETVFNIYDIDSRFNTAVCIHINGDADENTIINIVNCQKVKIDNNISGKPIINVHRSCLYYDSAVIDTIRQNRSANNYTFYGFDEVSLWYERIEPTDPNLVVNNMTVCELDAPVSSNIIDYWSENTPNDNHYAYALKSITFSDTLEIIRCELLVSNDSTNNKDERHSIVQHQFALPQGQGLTYPESSVTRPLKVSGSFVSAYPAEGEWITTDTNFSALTNVFGSDKLGSITFHASTHKIIANISEPTKGWEWEPGTYHIFAGGVVN